MTMQTINNELSFEIPDEYKALDEQEKKAWNPMSRKEDAILRNPSVHSAITISWKKTNILNRKMAVEKIIDVTGRTLGRKLPAYQYLKKVDATIAGTKAIGFQYSYVVQGSVQIAEYLLLKNNGVLYAFALLSRDDAFESNHHDFEGLLNTVKFKTE